MKVYRKMHTGSTAREDALTAQLLYLGTVVEELKLVILPGERGRNSRP